MKKYLLLLAFIISCFQAKTQCLVNSLTINTAYDPIKGLAIPGGANGAPPIIDPHWILTAETPTVLTGIAATSLSGLIPVVPGDNADIVTKEYLWALNHLGQPFGWISCLNSNYYVTDGTGITIYEMTLGRPFKLCSDDSLILDLYIASDNNITSADIDGVIPLSFSETALPLYSYFSTYTHFIQTFFLTTGSHTINFVVNNLNQVTVSANQAGLNVLGTVSSKTGLNTLVSESDPGCAGYACAKAANPCNDSITLLALPNPFTPGTGINNHFKIITRGIANLHYFRIFNSRGNKVFETSNIDNGWDGTFNGTPQPFDVYIYDVEATSSTGKVLHKHGNVTLIR